MIKIIKIITAINNPNLNNKLNEEKNIEIVCKDLQYKDAILDILNENINIDIIIINNEIPSEINDDELIKKIKEKNNKIRIIYILEKINKNIQEIFEKNNINEFYFNNEITIDKIIKIINKENINNFENSLIKNNNINKEKYYNNKFLINDNLIQNIKNKIKQKINKNKIIKEKIKSNFYENKIITISGPPNVGKTNFIINFYKIIKNKKILILDFDLNKKDIKLFLGIKKYYKINKKINKENKNIFLNINKNNYNNYLNSNFENEFNIINLENNVDLISIKELLKNKFNNDFDFLEFKNFIQNIFEKEKKNYDLILIDLGSENNSEINNLIFEKSDINILLTEGNLIGLNKLKRYINNFNKTNNFKIIINKKDLFSIDNMFIEKILKLEIIGEIKYKKFYSNLINNNFKFYYNFKNNYNKEYEKILKKLII